MSTQAEILAAALERCVAFDWTYVKAYLASKGHKNVEALVEEFKKFMALKVSYCDTAFEGNILSPSYKVDQVWHALLLFPDLYAKFCEQILNLPMQLIHHNPLGGDGKDREERFATTSKLYELHFGPPCEIWNETPVIHLPYSSFPPKKAVGEIEIYFERLDGTIMRVFAKPSDTIAHVKRKIELRTAIPICSQRLIQKGISFEDEKTLADYNVEEKSFVHLIQKLSGC